MLPMLEVFADLRSGVVPTLPFVGLIAGRTIVMIQTDLGLKKMQVIVIFILTFDNRRGSN